MDVQPQSLLRRNSRNGASSTEPKGITDRRTSHRLPSLLHELVHYDLVEKSDAGSWVLRSEVQSSLDNLVGTQVEDERLVFVGLRCQRCGIRTVTSLVEDVRLCDPCAKRRDEDDGDGIAEPSARGAAGHFRRHHFRRAG